MKRYNIILLLIATLCIALFVSKINRTISEKFANIDTEPQEYYILRKCMYDGCQCKPGYEKKLGALECTLCDEYSIKSNVSSTTYETCTPSCVGLKRPNSKRTACTSHDPTNSIMDIDTNEPDCPAGAVPIESRHELTVCSCSNDFAEIKTVDGTMKCWYPEGYYSNGVCPPNYIQNSNISYNSSTLCTKCTDEYTIPNASRTKCICGQGTFLDMKTGKCVNDSYLYDILQNKKTLFTDDTTTTISKVHMPIESTINSIDMRYLKKEKGLSNIILYANREIPSGSNPQMSDYGDLYITRHYFSNNTYHELSTSGISLADESLSYPRNITTSTEDDNAYPFKIDFEIPSSEIIDLATNDANSISLEITPHCKQDITLCGDSGLSDGIYDACGCLEYNYTIGDGGYAFMKDTVAKPINHNNDHNNSLSNYNTAVDTTTRKPLRNITGGRGVINHPYVNHWRSLKFDDLSRYVVNGRTHHVNGELYSHYVSPDFDDNWFLPRVGESNFSYDIRTLPYVHEDTDNRVHGMKRMKYDKLDLFRYFSMISAKGIRSGQSTEDNYAFFVTFPDGTPVVDNEGCTASDINTGNLHLYNNNVCFGNSDTAAGPIYISERDYKYAAYTKCEASQSVCDALLHSKKRLRATINLVYGQKSLYGMSTLKNDISGGINMDKCFNSVFGIDHKMGPKHMLNPYNNDLHTLYETHLPTFDNPFSGMECGDQSFESYDLARYMYIMHTHGRSEYDYRWLQSMSTLRTNFNLHSINILTTVLSSIDPKFWGGNLNYLNPTLCLHDKDPNKEYVISAWPGSYNRDCALKFDDGVGKPSSESHDDGEGQTCTFASDSEIEDLKGLLATADESLDDIKGIDISPFFKLNHTFKSGKTASVDYWNSILLSQEDKATFEDDNVRVMFIQNIYSSDPNNGVLIAYLPKLKLKKTLKKKVDGTEEDIDITDIQQFMGIDDAALWYPKIYTGADADQLDSRMANGFSSYGGFHPAGCMVGNHAKNIFDTVLFMIKYFNDNETVYDEEMDASVRKDLRDPYHEHTTIDDILDNLYILGRYTANETAEFDNTDREYDNNKYTGTYSRKSEFYKNRGVRPNYYTKDKDTGTRHDLETNWFKIDLRSKLEDSTDSTNNTQYIIEHPLQQRKIMDPYTSSHTIDRMIEDRYLEYPFMPLFLRMEKAKQST